VRIPERFRAGGQGKPGTVTDELISSVDFGPTVLRLAGLRVPQHMQGRAFLGEDLSPPRDFVYGARDRMDERYDIIRTVRDKKYRYIRNFEPLKPYYQYMNTPEKGATMQEIRRLEAEGIRVPFNSESKPVEELYDTEADAHEMRNLASDPAHAERLERLRRACLAWQFDVRDIGLLPESEITIREETLGARYAILRQGEGSTAMLRTLIDVADKASAGASAMADLAAALDHGDATVRHWAATGLGNFPDEGEFAAARLREALEDDAPSVRIAAARALCRMGDVESGLPVLRKELSGPRQWARLQAAIALDLLGEAARPALPELQAALHDQPNKYIVRVANKAVNDLLGTNNRVR